MLTMHAIRARLGQSSGLFAVCMLSVAGCVAMAGISRATDGPSGSAVMLLPLGVFAIAAQSVATLRLRRFEVALAQLRGASGLRLLRVAVAEPVVILCTAAALGAVAGSLLGSRVSGDDTAAETTAPAWRIAALLLAASISVVLGASWRIVREPLAAKLSPVERGGRAVPETIFLSVLVVVGALVSIYQARQLGVRDAGWVTFASAGLLGLAAGQAAVWLLTLLSQATRRLRWSNGRLSWFLTSRRLARRSNGIGLIRLTVAAVVLAGMAGTAESAAAEWRNETALVEAGGPRVFDVASGALTAYRASYDADPDGRWLMAMAAAPDPSGGSYRGVFADTSRWSRVVGSYYAGTAVADVTRQLGDFSPPAELKLAYGSTVSVTFAGDSFDRWWPTRADRRHLARVNRLFGYAPMRFNVRYLDAGGRNHALQLPRKTWQKPSQIGPGVFGYSAAAPGCARGCLPGSVSVQGFTRLQGTEITLGDLPLVPAGGGLVPASDSSWIALTEDEQGLAVRLRSPYESRPLLVPDRSSVALATGGIQLQDSSGEQVVYGLDGAGIPVRLTGTVRALPLLGTEGVLLDLGDALTGAGSQIPQATAKVVARADTPASVIQELTATGALRGTPTFFPSRTDFHGSARTVEAGSYWLCAVFALLIAAASLLTSAAAQRADRRNEAASVRVVGVDVSELRRSYRYEAAVLGIAVAVVSAFAIWIADAALLDVLPLVSPGRFGLALDGDPRLHAVVGFAVAAGFTASVVLLLSTVQIVRQSQPSRLRAEDR